MSKKYEPNPIKIAVYCHFDKRKVAEVLEQIKLEGAGNHMTTNQLERIRRLALKECDVIRNKGTVIRSMPSFNMSSDGLY